VMGRPKKDEARKEEILEAFERCVIREGITSTTLQKVADEAGLPRSLVRYFVGNRDEMIGLLISRVIGRAYRPLRELDSPDASFPLHELLDYLFAGAFLNNTTNSVVDRLWEIANSDESVRNELKNMYTNFKAMIEKSMKAEGLGTSAAQRAGAAQLLLSLAYGEASFNQLGMNSGKKDNARNLAGIVVSQLAYKRG
jgi:AcrR family transcriptional regulator